MKWIAKFLLLTLSTLFLFSCSEKEKDVIKLDCHASYSARELQQDFEILWTTLQEAHPDLYRVSKQESLESRVASIRSELEAEKSYLEFLKLIAPLFTDIACINTQWGHSREYINYRNEHIPMFPILFKIEEGSFIVQENPLTSVSIQEDDEILSINGVSVQDYLHKNYPLLPIDGHIKSIQHQWLAYAFPKHHSNFWEQPDSFLLKVKQGKEIKELIVPAVLQEDLPSAVIHNESALNYTIDSSVAYLRVGSLNEYVLKNQGIQFKKDLDSCFKTFKEENITSLILDIRGQGWGNLDFAHHLARNLVGKNAQFIAAIHEKLEQEYSFTEHIEQIDPIDYSELVQIQTPLPQHYDGNLFVIVNGWNINAKGYFASFIRNRENTVFIGEETGSSHFGMNESPIFLTLPNSGIGVRIPTRQISLSEKDQKSTEGVKPEITIGDLLDMYSEFGAILSNME